MPDELWGLFQRVVPEAPSRSQSGGRRRHGDREVPAAIVFVATPGCTWQQSPSASFGRSGETAHRRFPEWSKARVWAKLHRLVLDELGARGELDWSRRKIDSVNMRASKEAPGRPEFCRSGQMRLEDPPDYGTTGSAHIRRGSRLRTHTTAGPSYRREGNTADPLASRTPTAQARKLHADKGFDYAHLRRWLRQRRITQPNASPAKGASPHSGSADTAGPSNAAMADESTYATDVKVTALLPSQHRLHPYLLPQTHQMRHLLRLQPAAGEREASMSSGEGRMTPGATFDGAIPRGPSGVSVAAALVQQMRRTRGGG